MVSPHSSNDYIHTFTYNEAEVACEVKLEPSSNIKAMNAITAAPLVTSNTTMKKDYRRLRSYHSSNEMEEDRSSQSSTPTGESSMETNESVATLLNNLGDLAECRKITLVRAGNNKTKLEQQPQTNTNANSTCYIQNPFPVQAVTAVLESASQLLCLELVRVRLVGSKEDYLKLAQTIESQASLRSFSLETCRLDKNAAQQSFLEPVVRALASCTCISDITLMPDRPRSLGSLSVDTVAFLGRSPSLQVLRLAKMGIRDDQVTALAEALKNNTRLQVLRLSCSVKMGASTALAQMLDTNTTLLKLDIFLERVHDEQSTLQILRALQASTTLKEYDLNFNSVVPEPSPSMTLDPFGASASFMSTASASLDNTTTIPYHHYHRNHQRSESMHSVRHYRSASINSTQFLQEIHAEILESKELAKELENSSTRLTNCPFIRLLHKTMDAMQSTCGPTTLADDAPGKTGNAAAKITAMTSTMANANSATATTSTAARTA